jgi:hypothetical protein
MQVHFHRVDDRGGYAALIRRNDGQTVRLPGLDGRYRVPHDLAHFVTEREFGLTGGVFGCIAAGAMFTNMAVVGGRPRYDAASRSRAVLRRNAVELGLAECVSGVVHEAIESQLPVSVGYRRLQEAWGVQRSGVCAYQPADFQRALDVLGGLGARWRSLRTGEVLALKWDFPVRVPTPDRPPRNRTSEERLGRAPSFLRR